MRHVLTAILVLALALNVQSSCSNSFLEQINRAGVTVYASKSTSANHRKCKTEWNEHGSCCDADSLVALFNKETAAINESVEQVDKMAAEVMGIAIPLLKNLESGATKLKCSSEERGDLIDAIKTVQNENMATTLSTESHRCWDKMRRVRGSALCSVCSGRSNDFFKSDKAVVDYITCERVVWQCENFFHRISWFTDMFSKIFKHASDTINPNKMGHFKRMADTVEKFKLSDQLLNDLNKYRSISIEDPRLATHTINFCNHILNIRKATYIQAYGNTVNTNSRLLSLTRQDAQYFTSFPSSRRSSLKPRNTSPSNWHTASRSLNTIFWQSFDFDATDSKSLMPLKTTDNAASCMVKSDYGQPIVMNISFP